MIIAYSAHAGIVLSDDLIRVEIENPEMRNYVYAFLRTWFGRAMTRSSHYGNVIKHLEVSHLKQIHIPILEQLLDEVHRSVSSAFEARDSAHRLDFSARDLFARVMQNWPDATDEVGYTIPSSQMLGGRRRLEAYAYSPDSKFLSQLYNRNSESVTTLGSIAEVLAVGRFKRIFGETGVTYLDSEPIFKVNPEITKFLTPATDVDLDAYMVKRGWLLMACSGQIYGLNGQTTIANEWHEGKAVTQHILRIIPKKGGIRPGYLQTVLSHPTLGQPLVVSRAYGTSVPELAPEDIKQLPIPRLAPEIENEVAEAAETANKLRRQATESENIAVSKLESELSNVLGITPNRAGVQFVGN